MLSPSDSWAVVGAPMITDDPGTPGEGHWGRSVAALSSQIVGASTYLLPLVDADYGVAELTQHSLEEFMAGWKTKLK